MNYSRAPGDDAPLPRLVSTLHAVLRDPQVTAEERVRQAQAILRAIPRRHAASGANDPVGADGRTGIERGGLAPWQVRCVKEYVEHELAERLTGAELARRVRLSEHHFCRAFRISLRQTPRTYIVGRRVQRAREMMMSGESTIGQIALECGFADQAHFNRCFRKLFGTSPGVWRRAQIHTAHVGADASRQ
jgi:transcriptional regulator GlxA family with amidase domain